MKFHLSSWFVFITILTIACNNETKVTLKKKYDIENINRDTIFLEKPIYSEHGYYKRYIDPNRNSEARKDIINFELNTFGKISEAVNYYPDSIYKSIFTKNKKTNWIPLYLYKNQLLLNSIMGSVEIRDSCIVSLMMEGWVISPIKFSNDSSFIRVGSYNSNSWFQFRQPGVINIIPINGNLEKCDILIPVEDSKLFYHVVSESNVGRMLSFHFDKLNLSKVDSILKKKQITEYILLEMHY